MNMAKRDEVFPSKYPKASDLNGKPIAVVIESAVQETLKTLDGKEQTKTVLYFKGAKKALPLNMTNWDAVAAATGEDDTARWPGHTIALYPSTTKMKGETVDCIRIRPPAQRELPKVKPPAPKPPEADDMDDHIPF
jgi:hypothetical protein